MTLQHRLPSLNLDGAVACIRRAQTADGAIPWFEEGPWDPWNHVECAMALAVAGDLTNCDRALDFLAGTQAEDGSWLGEYGNALPMEGRDRIARQAAPVVRDTNFIAYPAVAAWHRFRLTGDAVAARRHWPMVQAAITCILSLQNVEGDIAWSIEAHGSDADDSLLAGNASMYKSLECAIRLADIMGEPRPAWRQAQDRLRAALRFRPHRFDRIGTDRSRFAMDWYYPVLSGAMPHAEATSRIAIRLSEFVEDGLGCRCVTDEPWVTVAETAELAMALVGIGANDRAAQLLNGLEPLRDQDGAYWMGWQFKEKIVWPRETPSWTQAAVILATDALYKITSAADVLLPNLLPNQNAEAPYLHDLRIVA